MYILVDFCEFVTIKKLKSHKFPTNINNAVITVLTVKHGGNVHVIVLAYTKPSVKKKSVGL